MMGPLTILLMNKLNVQLEMLADKKKHCNTPPNKQAFIKLFTANKCTTIID